MAFGRAAHIFPRQRNVPRLDESDAFDHCIMVGADLFQTNRVKGPPPDESDWPEPRPWHLSTFLLPQKCLERFHRRTDISPSEFRLRTCEHPMNAPTAFPDPETRSALQAHAAVSARRGHHALPQDHGRGRAGREGAGQGHAGGVARGAAGAGGGGLHRHQSSSAPGRIWQQLRKRSSRTRRPPTTTSSSPSIS